jgi:ketosteroid isomerase-like protein
MREARLVLDYLNAFSEKRIDDLAYMFDDKIELFDWDNHIVGKDAVLLFNIGLFETAKKIDVYIDQISDDSDVVFAKIKVIIDQTVLNVVDVITIANGKIKRIEAYKQ